ncbi:unnamed protein product [Didymodactylos carnosus]|uniref:Uncharacterized protein n=1 Tax=Didymodactylos carnosus TaxID=1234261 RepID=A0A814ZIE3_9BILA|nr:unnamed protein product [Didymodactylos carnosus]CAF1243682.1 unnamed protein product [Didymodactylos carnosus]CAF3817791.1 unnamed protein product [Didymodactylos carnosus]CAF4008194.1 unnamed protein product [Didymodactylos carnosus]
MNEAAYYAGGSPSTAPTAFPGVDIYTISSSHLRTNKVAKVNVTVKFSTNDTIDYNDLSSLSGFYLSPKNDPNAIQSLYERGDKIDSMLPIATAMLNNLFYTQVYQCTIKSLQSNYIQAVIDHISGLNGEKPTLCLYTPYSPFSVTIATPYSRFNVTIATPPAI